MYTWTLSSQRLHLRFYDGVSIRKRAACQCIYAFIYIHVCVKLHVYRYVWIMYECTHEIYHSNVFIWGFTMARLFKRELHFSVYMHTYIYICVCVWLHIYRYVRIMYECIYKLYHSNVFIWGFTMARPFDVFQKRATGWRGLIGSLKLQIIFHKRATKYRSLLRKMTCKDKGSYESSPPCTSQSAYAYIYVCMITRIYT